MARMTSQLTALLSVMSLVSAIEPPRGIYQPTGNGDRLLTFNETVPAATIRPSSMSVRWAASGEDGLFITTNDDGDLVLESIATGETNTFVTADQLPEDTHEYWISSDAQKMLIATNYTKEYRYSYYADYWILDVESGETEAVVEGQAGDIQYAVMAPDSETVAFVRGNDLYLRAPDGTVSQITTDGGPDKFNGVPDWVYEEEIFGDRYTLWFSPDSKFVTFLSFNETGVGTFTIPYYMDGQKIAPEYPVELDLRYPKVGSKNPTVQLNVLDVESGDFTEIAIEAFEEDDRIIGEVEWVTDAHSSFIYRVYNRVQDLEKLVVVNPETGSSETVRERDGTDGWLENMMAISYVGPINGSSSDETYYVDMSDEDGWMHIYLHSVQGGEPVQLTKGEWEVSSILKVDSKRHLVYYAASTHHSTERHVYSVSYTTKKVKALVNDDVPAVWSASFSSGGGFYILSYAGPDVPYQELYAIGCNNTKPIRTLTSNEAFYKKIDEYKLPNITYFELDHPDGYSMNVMQQLPADFDPSKKYPVLFTPYGGPNSQRVIKSFQAYSWPAYISSEPELQFICYTIDNRGTGFKGRDYRATVTRQLGKLEPVDQIWAAEQLIEKNSFIDANKIGMWGHSYGGYLTAKTLEEDSGVFSFGMISAPVSDWRFYDTMYTERFMKTLEDNEEGYNSTAVRNVEGFKSVAGTFSVLHGTGDDNVHYQNAAALLDLLVGGGVSPEKMKIVAFTDSDHGFSYNGASLYRYKFQTKQLWEEVQRDPKEPELVHQWSKKAFTA